jgi:hypothetical protein
VHRYDLVRDGVVTASELETYGWHPRACREVVEMLEAAGFTGVETVLPFSGEPASGDEGFIVYLARRR